MHSIFLDEKFQEAMRNQPPPRPNAEHLGILKQRIKTWKTWRKENPQIKPDLSYASLCGMDWTDFDFSRATLRQTNFERAKLEKADFRLAELIGTRFGYADVNMANFARATLSGTDARQTNFISARFSGAKIRNGAEFHNSNFGGTDFDAASIRASYFIACSFTEANFRSAEIARSQLTDSDFSHAKMESTVIAATDLGDVKGLDKVTHIAPSSLGLDTFYFSSGNISEKFLLNTGVPEAVIKYLPLIRAAMEPIQWHSCFISYSSQNEEFAQRLHSRMRQAGLRVWFAPEDMKGGDYFFEQIERAIQLHDRLLLVLSEESIQSKWVEREIRKARKIERAEKRKKLFPITLMDYEELKKWECLDSDTGEDLAEEVRKYHIPDFSNWKNHDAFERAFARLEKDLRMSIGK